MEGEIHRKGENVRPKDWEHGEDIKKEKGKGRKPPA